MEHSAGPDGGQGNPAVPDAKWPDEAITNQLPVTPPGWEIPPEPDEPDTVEYRDGPERPEPAAGRRSRPALWAVALTAAVVAALIGAFVGAAVARNRSTSATTVPTNRQLQPPAAATGSAKTAQPG